MPQKNKPGERFTTNKFFTELFLNARVTQIEFGHRTETDKNSVHDWVKHKNQMKFNKLEAVCKQLGLEIEIRIVKGELKKEEIILENVDDNVKLYLGNQ